MSISSGEQLRQLREERGLTLEQVSQGTHIRLQYLKALENDNRSALPSAMQGKGFLRVYAGFLNAPVQPLLDAWEGKLMENEPAITEQAEQPLVSEEDGELEPDEALFEPENKVPEPSASLPSENVISPSLSTIALLPSQKILLEIGEQLRQQREAVSLSLADVERFTRVRLHYLKALEEGRIDDLPSPVQGRGMLSNYAHFLNINTEAILLRFADALQARRLERLAPAASGPHGQKRENQSAAKPVRQNKQASPALLSLRRIMTPDLMIGGGLVLLLFVFVLWGAARISRLSASADVSTPPSISEILQITATPSLTPTFQSNTPVSTQALVVGEGGSEATPEVAGTPGAEIEVPTTTAPIQVYVVSHQRAFLRILADGEQIFNGRTTPGAAYTFTAKEQLELLSGNAAALQIFYQQRDLGPLGIVGQVVSMIFTPGEIITPTPSFTATTQATQTPATTPTSGPTQAAVTITPYLP